MPTPSLLIVPSRWKTGNPGKLYSQIPTNGNGDFNVTGVVTGAGNIGTRVNDLGYIETIITSGTPRLDYYTSSGTPGCPALLVEPSAQNLALQSQDFSTTWSPVQILAFGSGSVLNTTATLDPYGTNVSDLIVANTTLNQHRVDQTITHASGSYVFSVFLKAAGYGFARLRIGGAGATFNLSTGVVAATDAGITSSIQSFGNGWYRCIILKAAAIANEIIRINMQPTQSTADFIGDGTSGIYVFGAQYETGSVATSYIPTTTGSVTRNADVVSVSGAVSGSIGQTEGVLYIECESNFANDDIIAINRDFSNAITIYKGGSNQVVGRVYASGATFSFTSSATTGVMKIALAYKSGDSALFLNGVQVGSTNTTALTFSAALNLISMTKAAGYLAGLAPTRIRAVALYTTRLSNADLMLLTMPGNNTYLPQAVWNNYLSRTGNTELPDCLYTRHADLLDV